MGKRKSKARVMKKEKPVVPKIFDCPFCNHASTVEARMNKANMVGEVSCRVCDAKFQMAITNLSDPIDVYSQWIDETEEANRQVLEDAAGGGGGRDDDGDDKRDDY